jgi:hypothetical protein
MSAEKGASLQAGEKAKVKRQKQETARISP